MDREAAERTMRWMADLRSRGWYRPRAELVARAWHPDTGFLVTNLTRMPLDQVDFGSGVPKHFYPIGGARVAVLMAAPNGVRVLVGHPEAQ
jgi:hypothetical protein